MMAQVDVPFSGANFVPTAPQEATSFTAPLATPMEDENSDDWEYEYSTTETETYYLTLDLTTPVVDPQRKPPSKGGLKTKWLNPYLGRNKRDRSIKPSTYSTITGQGEVELEEEDADEQDVGEDDREPGEDELSQRQEYDMPTKVQILDFHSGNPIVSYAGHVYSCHWAKNVGTELLFTEHDRDNEIPALRTLPGGVDLLAAATARLVSNYVEVERKELGPLPNHTYTRGSNLPDKDIILPVGKGASDERKDQAGFLQRLMEIKREKGETDEVTVIGLKRYTTPKWLAQLKIIRTQERKKLNSIVKKSKPSSDEFIEAKAKLKELDAEDAELQKRTLKKNTTYKKGSKGNTRGRKRKVSLDMDEERVFVPRKRIRKNGAAFGEEYEARLGMSATPKNEDEEQDSDQIEDDDGLELEVDDDEEEDEDAPGEDDE